MNWDAMFSLEVSPLEIVVRGTLMYLFIYFLFRFIFRRESGATSITDLLVLVLIADAAQNGMAGEYMSITNGLVLVAVILFWAAALNALAWKLPVLSKLVKPHPLPMVRNGKLLRENLAKELMTEDELFSQLREQGVTRLREVRLAQMEPDGKLSIVRSDAEPTADQSGRDQIV